MPQLGGLSSCTPKSLQVPSLVSSGGTYNWQCFSHKHLSLSLSLSLKLMNITSDED